jgi:transposase-like protein
MVSRKPHPAELRERAVQMVFELRAETGNARGSIARVGHRLGINTETLRNWVNKAEVDAGGGLVPRPGIRSGSPSWSGKTVNCVVRMRS